MSIEYEVVYFDLSPYPGRTKPVPTLLEAAARISCANDYVVAIENGKRRDLTEEEELEYQSARRKYMRQSA